MKPRLAVSEIVEMMCRFVSLHLDENRMGLETGQVKCSLRDHHRPQNFIRIYPSFIYISPINPEFSLPIQKQRAPLFFVQLIKLRTIQKCSSQTKRQKTLSQEVGKEKDRTTLYFPLFLELDALLVPVAALPPFLLSSSPPVLPVSSKSDPSAINSFRPIFSNLLSKSRLR